MIGFLGEIELLEVCFLHRKYDNGGKGNYKRGWTRRFIEYARRRTGSNSMAT